MIPVYLESGNFVGNLRVKHRGDMVRLSTMKMVMPSFDLLGGFEDIPVPVESHIDLKVLTRQIMVSRRDSEDPNFMLIFMHENHIPQNCKTDVDVQRNELRLSWPCVQLSINTYERIFDMDMFEAA